MGAATGPCTSICGKGAIGVGRDNLSPEMALVAWMRRRSGPDCEFAEVFEEVFGSRDPVGEAKFVSTLRERCTSIDLQAAFRRIDAAGTGNGVIGASEFEEWQQKLEEAESEGLRVFRDFLKKRYPTPSAAYNALGKGEGDVLSEVEFATKMGEIGFQMDNPLELFRFVDKDFSGEITFAEFKASMRGVNSAKGKSGDASPGLSPRGTSRGTPTKLGTKKGAADPPKKAGAAKDLASPKTSPRNQSKGQKAKGGADADGDARKGKRAGRSTDSV